LLVQLFGDRAIIGNATGCSSIYGGNLPTTPYTKRADGRGPAWSNSLFEDNAEFAFGMRLAVNSFKKQAINLLEKLREPLNGDFVDSLINANPVKQVEIEEQRARVVKLKEMLKGIDSIEAKRLYHIADF